MDSIKSKLQNLQFLSDSLIRGDDLTIEKYFLELGFLAERFYQEIDFLYYLEKLHMTLCFKSCDLQIEDGFKISKLSKNILVTKKG